MTASVTALLPRASMTVWPVNTGIPSARSARAERAGLGAQVGDGHDLDAGGPQRRGGVQPAIRGGGDHRALAGADRVQRGQPPGAAGEHHAGQVVAGEHQRLLDRAGGEHVARGADLVQGVALPHRDQAVEVAQRGARVEDLDPGLARVGDERGQALAVGLDQLLAAGLGALVGEHDVGAQAAAAIAAFRPAIPPPTTSTSAWRRRYSVRHSRSGC